MRSPSLRPLALAVLLAVLAVALTVWAVSAYRYASATRHWPTAKGTVVQPDPHRPPAVTYTDRQGNAHLMPLHEADTDDLPVGASIRVVYDLSAGGRLRTEFVVQPGARASALTVLALLCYAGSGVAFWRFRVTSRTEGEVS